MNLSWPDIDKFAAIGGAAKLMAELTDDEYIAGFFRKSIVSQLAWYPALQDRSVQRPNIWRAPSWSWASVDDKVFMEKEPEESPKLAFAILLAVDYELADPSNQFGSLRSASLTLQGWLIGIEREGIYRSEYGYWGNHYAQVIYDDYEARENLVIFLTHYYKLKRTIYVDGVRTFSGSGLILEPVHVLERVDSGVYKRVGSFHDVALEDEMFAALMESQETVMIICCADMIIRKPISQGVSPT